VAEKAEQRRPVTPEVAGWSVVHATTLDSFGTDIEGDNDEMGKWDIRGGRIFG
jgi:hypothetical protein